MNIRETGELLTLIQVVDNRRVDEAVLLTWQDLLDDVDLAVAREAVRLHRRETPAWITPAHVRANVARILASAVPGQDQWGNDLPVDTAAQEALSRIRFDLRAVTS